MQYIVTVQFMKGIGYSIICDNFEIEAKSMKEAKELGKVLIPSGQEIYSVKAHKA